jgi:hypothetical protein
MNRNKTQYDISKVLSEGAFQIISDLSNELYNNEVWRNYATWGRLQRSRTWDAIVKNSNIKVMATVLDVNSAKPLTALGGYSTYGGSIPKIGIGSKITEQDILNMMELEALGTDIDLDTAKDLVRVPLEDLYQGIHSKFKFFCLQGISTGNVVIDVSNQVNGKYLSVDLNVPAKSKKFTVKVWSDITADPLQELLDMQRYAKNTLKLKLDGYHWEMTQTKFDAFMAHPEVVKLTRGRLNILNTDYIVTDTEKLGVFTTLGLKPIVVVDELCAFDVDGEATEIEPFDTDNVVLVTNEPWFEMKRAVSAHSVASDNSAMRSTVEECIAAVSTWDSRNLINNIDVEAWAFPVPKNPNNILILDTAATS